MKKFHTIKKSRKKSKDIDEKIQYLNKECQKTGIDEAMRTYSVYQGARIADNETHTDFAAAAFGGRGLGYSGMDNVAIGGAKIGDMVASEHGLDPVAHSSILGLKGVAQSPMNPNTNRRSFASTRTGMVDMSPAQPGKYQGTQGAVTGSIIWYWDATANNSNGTQGDWRQLQFFPNSDNTDGYWAVWGSNFLGFSVPRQDLVPSQLNGIINNLQISGKGTIGTPQTTVFTQNRLDDPGFIPIDIKGLSTQGYNYLKDKAGNLLNKLTQGKDVKPTQTPKQRRGSAYKKMREEGNKVGANQFYTNDRIKELNGKEKLTAREESELKDLQQYNEWINTFDTPVPIADEQSAFDKQAAEDKQSFDNEFSNNSNEIASNIASYIESTPDLSAEEKKALTSISNDIRSGKTLDETLKNNIEPPSDSNTSTPPPPTPEIPKGVGSTTSEHQFPNGTSGTKIQTNDGKVTIFKNSDGERVEANGKTKEQNALLNQIGKGKNTLTIGGAVATNSITTHKPSAAEIEQFITSLDGNMLENGKITVTGTELPYQDGNFKVSYDKNGKRVFESNRDADGNQGANFPDNSIDSPTNASMSLYGKPNLQVVFPPDGSEPYVVLEKYAYENRDAHDKNSPSYDPTEVPKGVGLGSNIAHFLGNLFKNSPLYIPQLQKNSIPKEISDMNIHGMAHTKEKIPFSDPRLSEEFKNQFEGNEDYDSWSEANESRQTASKFPPPGQEAEHTNEDGGKVKYYNRGIRTRPDGTKYMEVLVLPWIEPKAGVHDGYFGSLHNPGSYTTKVEMNHLPDAKPYEADGDLMPSNPDFRGAGNNKKFKPSRPKNVRGSGARNNRGRVNETLTEAVKLGHFEPEALTVDLEKLRKGILPEFPKDPPPKLVNGYSEKSKLLPQKVEGEPFIKVDKKELAKNHKLKDSEIKEFMDEINMINEYIKQNPAELVHAMQRYPKHDVRLAQLNWQMDQQLQASEDYMETHFPENERLFNKLQTKIKQNIDLTDPNKFKGHKEAPKFDQTAISEQERRRPTSGLMGVEAQQASVKVNYEFGETENVSPPSYNQKEKRLKEEIKQINAEYEKWKSNWRDDIKLDEGMTTSGLYKVNLPSTGNDVLQDIPYGLTGTGEINYGSLLSNTEEDPNTLVNPNDEYTALTNMAGMFDAPDPRGVGQMPRTFDIETQKFNGYTNIGGSDSFNPIVPGYKLDSVRYVVLSGAHRNRALDDDPPGGYYPFPNENSGPVRLHFNGVGSPRFIAMKPVDTREVDTLRVTASRGEYSIRSKAVGGWTVDPRPMIYYWAGNHPDYKPTTLKTGGRPSDNKTYDHSNVNGPATSGLNRHRGAQQWREGDGWRPIHMKPDGTLDNSVNPYIIDYERFGDNAVRLPDWARGENARYMIFQNHSGSTFYSAWTLRNVQFQRKNNMTTFRRLDDPQASAFIRVGQGAGNQTAQQRRKKVRDMIKASIKYGKTKFGDGLVNSTNID